MLTSALGRKPEKVVTSDLATDGFPADVGEGEVNLAIPLVATGEYSYLSGATSSPECNTFIPKSAQCECERVMLTRFVKY